ncbi:MAG: hypothetical protein HYY35_03675 [Deltaproteobacteria bacterium]|nr:hypothetical protein [Deltaproteobacteria bacterium]
MAKVLARSALALVAVASIVSAALAWRLGQGPIPLALLDRRVAQALGDLSPGIRARVARTELAWADRRPTVRVLDVSLEREDGSPVASLPMLSLRLSLRALLSGRFAVARIGLSGVRLALVRGAEGSLALGGAAGGDAPGAGRLLAMLAAAVLQDGNAVLHGVRIRDAALTLEDRISGSTWEVSGADLDVRRRAGGSVAGDLRATVALRAGSAAHLRDFALGVSAHAEAFGGGGRLDRLSFAIAGSGGRLAFGGGGTAATIDSLRAEGSFSAASAKLELRGIDARVGGARLAAEADVIPGRSAELRGEAHALGIGDLDRLWPAGLAGGAREWIRRSIRAGVLSRARFTLRWPLALDPGAAPAAPAADVAFEFDGVEIHYLEPLPPVRSARGSATLTAERFAARVERAEVGDLRVPGAHVSIALRGRPPQTAIEVDVEGASADLLDFLERPPLAAVSRLGIPSTRLGGQSRAHAAIRFPLVRGLTRADVRVAGSAELRDATAAALLGRVGIDGGRLDVRLAEDGGIEVRGATVLTGVPGAQGPLDVRLSFTPEGGGGRLQAALRGADAEAEGSASFESGQLQSLSLKRLKLGRSELGASVVRRERDGFRASLAGERLDLEPWLERLRSGSGAATRIGFAYDLDFRFARVLAAAGFELADASGTVQGDGGGIRRAAAAGRLAPDGEIKLELAPVEGGRRLGLSSDRGGETLKALGLYDGAVGGRLILRATIDDAQPPTRAHGEIELGDFRVLRAPVLAQILSLGSFEGIAGMLDRDGIPFTRVRVPFLWSERTVQIHDARAAGAIGLTADGEIERASRRVELHGDIIPADTLNSALGNVPLVGSWIAGGEGAGLFGIEYRVSGLVERPEVRVNPLTALAPGALRKMFGALFAPAAEPTPERR